MAHKKAQALTTTRTRVRVQRYVSKSTAISTVLTVSSYMYANNRNVLPNERAHCKVANLAGGEAQYKACTNSSTNCSDDFDDSSLDLATSPA